MKMLDLFSGVGGFSLGLERAGMTTVAFCEIDPYCQKVLRKHWPEVPIYDDITTREFVPNEADVITAGFPCQDLSYAGRGAGLAGERSGLWREVVRAVRVVRPSYVILENVSALLGRGLGTVLGDLAALGYDAEWHCIPASAVGAPHRRDRIWIVAYPGGQQHESRSAQISREIAAQLHDSAAYAEAMFGPEIVGGEPDGDRAGAGEMADATGIRCNIGSIETNSEQGSSEAERCSRGAGAGGSDGSDANGTGSQGRHGGVLQERSGEWTARPSSPSVGHAVSLRELQPQGCESDQRGWAGYPSWWFAEPDVGRVADGIPKRVDRLRSLGNAVVPQIPEMIGHAIMAAQTEERSAA